MGKDKLDDECVEAILKSAEESINRLKLKLAQKGRETESKTRIFRSLNGALRLRPVWGQM